MKDKDITNDQIYNKSQELLSQKADSSYYPQVQSFVLRHNTEQFDLNKQIISTLAGTRDSYETPEETLDALKLIIAGLYQVCKDNNIKLNDSSDIFEQLKLDIYKVVDVEMAGEVIKYFKEV